MREFVEDGTVEAFALWNPADLGYLAALRPPPPWRRATSLARRATPSRPADLGEYTVGADGEVLLGEPFVYDKSNIADFDF